MGGAIHEAGRLMRSHLRTTGLWRKRRLGRLILVKQHSPFGFARILDLPVQSDGQGRL
jgi:ketosteroid isomerase-like protein